MRIKNRIVLVYLSLKVLTVVSLFFITMFLVRTTLQDQTYNQLLALVESRAAHIETYFEQNVNQLKLITSRTKLRTTLDQYNELGEESQLQTISEIIADAKKDMPHIDRICILSLTGKVLVSTNENYCGRDVAKQDFFLTGEKESTVNFIEEDGSYNIYFSGPMILENELIGVGMMVIGIEELSQIVNNREGLGETGEVLIAFYDVTGRRTYPLKRLFEKEAITLEEESSETALPMKQALLGHKELFPVSLDYRDQQVIAASSYIDVAKLGVVAKIDTTEALQSLRNISMFFGIAAMTLILLVYLISSFIAQWISRPIEQIRSAAKRIAAGDLKYKISKIQRDDEIGELAEALDKMVSELKESRKDVDQKVADQTREIKQKGEELQDQQKAILNILEDVEEEKNRVELLAADLEKFKLAVAGASDHIVITDPDGITLYANKAVERITGFSEKEVMGKKAGGSELWGGLMEKSFYEEMWKIIKKDKKVFAGEFHNKRKDGEEYDALASISPILNSQKEVVFFVGIERDITKIKEVDKAKTEFVSLASHQLRTPLSAINWYTEMLLAGDAGKINKEQKNYLEEIYSGNQRMVDLVNSLLNVSRLELGTFVVEPEKLNIKDVAVTVIEELKVTIKEKKLKFSSKYDRIEDIKADKNLVRIIFQNLLSNAVKYTPAQGKVILEIINKSKYFEIIVADSGYGIPKNQHDKIFSKLFRADNVRKMDTEGSGLGLYIIKAILDHIGGEISFKSKEDQGTTFYVKLPKKGMEKKKEGTKKLS